MPHAGVVGAAVVDEHDRGEVEGHLDRDRDRRRVRAVVVGDDETGVVGARVDVRVRRLGVGRRAAVTEAPDVAGDLAVEVGAVQAREGDLERGDSRLGVRQDHPERHDVRGSRGGRCRTRHRHQDERRNDADRSRRLVTHSVPPDRPGPMRHSSPPVTTPESTPRREPVVCSGLQRSSASPATCTCRGRRAGRSQHTAPSVPPGGRTQITLSPASTRARRSAASRSRWNAAVPKLTRSSCTRLRYRWTSHSQVKPMPPWTCRVERQHPVGRVRAPGLGHRRRHRGLVIVGGDAPRRPPRRRPHALDVDQHVGAAVLDGLEAPDGPAELHAVAGVGDREVQAPGRGAEQLGGVGDRPAVEEVADRLRAPQPHRGAVRRAPPVPAPGSGPWPAPPPGGRCPAPPGTGPRCRRRRRRAVVQHRPEHHHVGRGRERHRFGPARQEPPVAVAPGRHRGEGHGGEASPATRSGTRLACPARTSASTATSWPRTGTGATWAPTASSRTAASTQPRPTPPDGSGTAMPGHPWAHRSAHRAAVPASAGVDHGAHHPGRGPVRQQLRGRVPQGLLVVGQLEVHGGMVAAAPDTGVSRDAVVAYHPRVDLTAGAEQRGAARRVPGLAAGQPAVGVRHRASRPGSTTWPRRSRSAGTGRPGSPPAAGSGVAWPAEYGGRGAGPVAHFVVQEELARARAPELVGRIGVNLVGPTLLAHGTPEQKDRWLPRILDAAELWCQLFSEPDAGSDLAVAVHPRRPRRRRRRLAARGPEGVDQLRPVRRLGPVPRPHRPRRAQAARASRPSSSTCAHPGVEVRPLRADHRRGRVQRGVLRRRLRPRRPAGRPARTRAGGSPSRRSRHERGVNPRQLVIHIQHLEELLRLAARAGRVRRPPARASSWPRRSSRCRLFQLHNWRSLVPPRGGASRPGPRASRSSCTGAR